MPTRPVFATDEDGDPVSRLRWEITEATTAQAAGVNGGRVSSSQSLTVVSTGAATERVIVAGVNPAHAEVQGSLDGVAWTDLSGGLAIGGAEGDEVEILVRLLVKRWNTLLNPSIDKTLRVGSVGVAGIEDAEVGASGSFGMEGGGAILLEGGGEMILEG